MTLLALLSLLAATTTAPRLPDAADVPHEDAAEPVDMTVRVVGDPRGEWVLVASGRAHLPASDATLHVRSPDARLAPAAGEGAEHWRRPLSLPADGRFEERFRVAPAEDGTLVVDFEHDASPDYFLKRLFVVRVEQGHARVEPVSNPGTPDDPGSGVVENTGGDEVSSDPGTTTLVPGLGETVVKGTVYFRDQGGASKVCGFCYVEVYDDDGATGDDLLAQTEANANGFFSARFRNSLEEDLTRQDVYLIVWTDSWEGIVYKPTGVPHSQATGVLRQDVADGTVDLGSVHLATSGTTAKAFWVHRALVKGWNVIRTATGYDLGPTTAVYPADALPGDPHAADDAHYHVGGDIHLGSTQTAVDVVSHEQGHHAMWHAYDAGWPAAADCPSPHSINGDHNRGCAWTEGWANYVALAVWSDPRFTFASGSWINLESWTCSWGSCGTGSGDDNEGRVAGALWDLLDGAADGYDNADYLFSHTWNAFRHAGGGDTTFQQYYDNWRALGYSATDFKNAARQNTIVYA